MLHLYIKKIFWVAVLHLHCHKKCLLFVGLLHFHCGSFSCGFIATVSNYTLASKCRVQRPLCGACMVSQCLHGFSWVVRFSSKDTVGLLVDARLAVGENVSVVVCL